MQIINTVSSRPTGAYILKRAEHVASVFLPAGIYLCEHRNTGGYGGGHARSITITVQGLVQS
jgi:hypothetical protein